jgi:hypothetical protein
MASLNTLKVKSGSEKSIRTRSHALRSGLMSVQFSAGSCFTSGSRSVCIHVALREFVTRSHALRSGLMSVQFSAVSCFTSGSRSVCIHVALREFAFSVAFLRIPVGYNVIVRREVTAETSAKATVYCGTVRIAISC